MRKQPNILNPNNRCIKVLASTLVPNIRLLHNRIPTKELFLRLPQRRTSLHQIDRVNTRRESLKVPKRLDTAISKPNHHHRDQTHPQHIIHQSTLPRPNLDQLHTAPFPPLRQPFRNRPYANQFTERLRYLGGRDEVALLPEDFAGFRARRVVAAVRGGQDLAHERGDWDGACDLVVVSRGCELAAG